MPTVTVTLSPTLASPPTVPVMAIVWPASVALTELSAVTLSTVIVALATVSTVYARLALALAVLPAASVTVIEAPTLLDAASTLPATSMLYRLPAVTSPL